MDPEPVSREETDAIGRKIVPLFSVTCGHFSADGESWHPAAFVGGHHGAALLQEMGTEDLAKVIASGLHTLGALTMALDAQRDEDLATLVSDYFDRYSAEGGPGFTFRSEDFGKPPDPPEAPDPGNQQEHGDETGP